jgi:hypothetical protein
MTAIQTFNFLAESDDGIGKIIVGVIVFVIWGIGAMANMAKKQGKPSPQAQAAMERAMREQMDEAHRRDAAHAMAQMDLLPPPLIPQGHAPRHGPAVPPMRNISQMPMPPRVPLQRRPVGGRPAMSSPQGMRQPPPPMVPVARNQPKQQKKQKQRRAAAVTVPSALHQTFAGDTPGVRESEIGQGIAPASPARRQAQAMDGAAVLRLTPASLRQQFILTEILRPPLALRE